MTTPTVQYSANGLIALTRAELDYLQTYVDAGDRGGFYAAYYNITGNSQALEQLQIATFSEGLGGTAYVANYALQKLYGQPTYKGIYFLSQRVAISAFSAINTSATTGGSGYIDGEALFRSAQAAWIEQRIGDLFPGNLLSGINNATKWIQDNISSTAIVPITVLIRAVADALNKITEDARTTDAGYRSFADTLLTTGAGTAFLASIGSIALGKRQSDYLTADYSSVALPDGKLVLTFNNNNREVVAGFNNQLIPTENFQFLDLLSRAAALTLGLPITLAAEFNPFLRDWLTWYRQHLSEYQTPNGDFGGLANTYLYDKSPYQTTTTGTGGSDTVFGTSPTLLIFGGNDNLDAGGSDDQVFTGAGNDFIIIAANDSEWRIAA